jgi:hypothetical protein
MAFGVSDAISGAFSIQTKADARQGLRRKTSDENGALSKTQAETDHPAPVAVSCPKDQANRSTAPALRQPPTAPVSSA